MRTTAKWIVLICLINVACYSSRTISGSKETPIDEDIVLNSSYPVGDVRRYGVFPDSLGLLHPNSKKPRIETVLDFAENTGIEISFPKVDYRANLILDHRQNIRLRFNKTSFNLVHITKPVDSLPRPSNIHLRGTIISYDRVGITEASNISMDTIILRSNSKLNLSGMRGRGCHIYHGNDSIQIKYLQIDDFGSDGPKYKYNHAALALDGWNNNPKNVHIEKLIINSSDRHGIYITGSGHYLEDVVIKSIGMGSPLYIDPMQDAIKGEEIEFKPIWINKCYDTRFGKVLIDEGRTRARWTAHFDYGDPERPVIMEQLIIKNDNPNIQFLEENNNGVQIVSKEIHN